jgi:chitinase
MTLREPPCFRATTLVAALIASLVAAEAEARSTDFNIVGYYISWAGYQRHYKPRDIDAAKFNAIIYAFADVKNGGVRLADPAVDESNFAELRKLKSKNAALKLLISVGGWTGSKYFSNAAATAAGRLRLADSAVVFLRDYGFDGVDLDWEYPVAGGSEDNVRRPEDRQNLTLLLRTLRKALDAAGEPDGRKYLLTLAAGASPEYATNTELGNIARIVDWVGLMSYDFSGSPWSKTSGHNAPLFADPANPRLDTARETVAAAVMRTLQAGVPPTKLLLGLPLFAPTWRGCALRNNGEYQECSGAAKGTWDDGVLDYQDIVSHYLTNPAFVRHFNQSAKVPFLFDADSGQFISYDDAESFRYKVQFLKEKQLGGAAYWEITADREGSLIDLVAKELVSDRH